MRCFGLILMVCCRISGFGGVLFLFGRLGDWLGLPGDYVGSG